MEPRKLTVQELLAGKGRTQRTSVFVTDVDEAAAVEAAGLDMMVIGDDAMSDEIRHAAPSTFITAALAYAVHATTDDYLRSAFAMYRLGADAVYCAASTHTISRLSAEGVPVVGHIGFIPTHGTWTGGFRAVGKTLEGAMRVWRQARALEWAGAFAAEIEIVPAPVAAAISARSPLFLISMGSGAGCDAQYLFAMDILGSHSGHYPRHAKVYRDFRSELARLQADRIAAFVEYREDVETGAFPSREHVVPIDGAELERFLEAIDRDDDGDHMHPKGAPR